MSTTQQVTDLATLTAYLKKREEWFSWHEDQNEPNSIRSQINLMIFSEMSYRVLRQERDRNSESELAVPAVAYLLDTGYFSAQIMAIRKLLDAADNVLSLRRLIRDLKKHKNLITREVFVSYDSTAYEPGLPTISVPGLQPADSPFSQWSKSTRRHNLFDRLSGVAPTGRSRTDLIRDVVMLRLEEWIDSSGAQELILLCNKYLAHAANSKSRGSVVNSGISFAQVESVQRVIVRVAKAIYDLILTSGVYSPVVVQPQLGYFGNVWTGPGLCELVESVRRMNSDWDALEIVRNEWPKGLEDELLK